MISVILCGGAGSRLWPLSRERHPKPFIPLPDGQSLIQKAFQRAAALPAVSEVLTVTNKKLHFKAADAFKAAGAQAESSYILEPFGRNTAPAITAAALDAKRRYGEEAELLVLAADHLIADTAAFEQAVNQARTLIAQDLIVTFGIKPSRPETGYGYIEAEGNRVLRFVEKPDLENARRFLAAGGFFWNAGMFCFKAGVLLSEMAAHAPESLAIMETCLASSRRKPGDGYIVELNEESFAAVPDISIDYVLMEKSGRVAVVPCDIGWSDIGSWTELCALTPADEAGNHVQTQGRTVLADTRDCDIRGGDRLVAALGLDHLMIVDTPDALLVADKSKAQDVKNIYNQLKDEGDESYKHHRTVYRPWGAFTLLESGPRFKIKRLTIKPGGCISLQMHRHRNEHWIVVAGSAEVSCENETSVIGPNESTYIKAGQKHRVANKGLIDLQIIEVQSGDYLGEDDIVRFEDLYGRDVERAADR